MEGNPSYEQSARIKHAAISHKNPPRSYAQFFRKLHSRSANSHHVARNTTAEPGPLALLSPSGVEGWQSGLSHSSRLKGPDLWERKSPEMAILQRNRYWASDMVQIWRKPNSSMASLHIQMHWQMGKGVSFGRIWALPERWKMLKACVSLEAWSPTPASKYCIIIQLGSPMYAGWTAWWMNTKEQGEEYVRRVMSTADQSNWNA